jgi:hypothetical protein
MARTSSAAIVWGEVMKSAYDFFERLTASDRKNSQTFTQVTDSA